MRHLGLAIAIPALLVLAACKDYGRCLASHHETQFPYLAWAGSDNPSLRVMAFIPQDVEVCDRWEFPEGR